MKEALINPAWHKEALHALQEGLSSPLSAWRLSELEKFLAQGFPDRHVENWKYTSVNAIAKQAFSLRAVPKKIYEEKLSLLPDAYSIVFLNGHLIEALSNLPVEIEFIPISKKTTMREDPAVLMMEEDYQTPFSLMNSGLFSAGFTLRVPQGVCLKKPIHLVYITEGELVNQTMLHMRNLFFIEENASVTFFEEYIGDNTITYFNNIVNQLIVGSKSQVYFHKLQHEGANAFHIANTTISQSENSEVETAFFSLGAKLGRDDLNYALKGIGAFSKIFGYYQSSNGALHDHHVRIDHRISQCSSHQNYKGIIGGQSKAVFNGKIIVHPDAQKTAANQSNKNLLLEQTAEVNAKPELEIYADDVKCSHGATVGQLDESALFYLRSRGIGEKEARHLLSAAFVEEILEQLHHQNIAAFIKPAVMGQLQHILSEKSSHV